MRPWVCALLVATAGCGHAASADRAPPAGYDFPALSGRVVDVADLLPPDREAALAARLAGLEARTHHQLVVVTVPALGGHRIEDYGRELGNFWGIGRRGANDGVILLVAPTEHEVRIAVGYGLEKALTDREGAAILASDVLPRFKAGDMAGGIEAGAADVIREITP